MGVQMFGRDVCEGRMGDVLDSRKECGSIAS